jgi:Bacterial SH3 domain
MELGAAMARRAARPERRRRSGGVRQALGACLLAVLTGCAHTVGSCPPPDADSSTRDLEVYRRAEADRAAQLEREVARLREDLRNAEGTLVEAESGLRGTHTRAEAVSLLAEAGIQVDRAADRAPWRADAVAEARAKLSEAERQLDAGRIGSAVFFASRASRIAATLLAEADEVAKADARFVKGSRVNLRQSPSLEAEVVGVLAAGLPVFPEGSQEEWTFVRTASGQVGWVHSSLLR